MPPVSRPIQTQGQEPSIYEKMKMGAIMGIASGCIVGIIFGSIAIYSYGPGPKGYMRTMGQYMTNSAATFGLLMSVGSVIRSEGRNPEQWRRMYQEAAQKN